LNKHQNLVAIILRDVPLEDSIQTVCSAQNTGMLEGWL